MRSRGGRRKEPAQQADGCLETPACTVGPGLSGNLDLGRVRSIPKA